MKTLALLTGLALSLTSFTQADLTGDALSQTTNHSAVVSISPAFPVGRVNGPATVTRRVEAHQTNTDYFHFEVNELAQVTVKGDGDCDLDLYVYDFEGTLVAQDNDYTDYCIASWIPDYHKSYRIVVMNRGDIYADYVLSTN